MSFPFSTFFLKNIMNQQIKFEDLEEFDQEIYNSFKWILENDINH